MIYGKLETADEQSVGHAGILRAVEYARTHDLAALAPGRHDIDGDILYVNRADYSTKALEECAFEAHRRYIDVHVVIEGEERIDCEFADRLSAGPYDEAGDSMALEGAASASAVARPGVFVACFPEDAHKPGIAIGASAAVKKAVFKVAIG